MRIDDFKKKENWFKRFLDKYLGMKYSVGFAIGKQLLKEKPSATGLVSGLIGIHILWIVLTESSYIWWLIGAWCLSYFVQLVVKLHKKKSMWIRISSTKISRRIYDFFVKHFKRDKIKIKINKYGSTKK